MTVSARAAAILAFTVLALLYTACGRSVDDPPHAVFLIVVDTLRPDRLSCYGYDKHETPHIDRLAAMGVRFANAHSAASWTVPSMGALLTSRYPTQLGLIERAPREPTRFKWREKRSQVRYTPPRSVRAMAEVLDDAGYYPVAFVNQPFISFKDGFLQGFAEWCYTAGEDSLVWHDTTEPIPRIDFPPGTDLGQADDELVAEFVRWMGANADRRPFVWLHLLKPHTPYTPAHGPSGKAPPTELYDAEVRESDDMVGRILDAVERYIGLDRCLVVVASDHGEAFGEHGMFEHGHSLHGEVTRVPLVIVSPSLPAGVTVERNVRLIDVFPTVVELTGATAHAPGNFEGTSLIPIIRGEAVNLVVYSEGMLYGSTERSIMLGASKLMFDEQREKPYRFFMLARDPGETLDVGARNPGVVEDLEERMGRLHARLVEESAGAVGDDEESIAEDEATLEALRALGYVGAGGSKKNGD